MQHVEHTAHGPTVPRLAGDDAGAFARGIVVGVLCSAPMWAAVVVALQAAARL